MQGGREVKEQLGAAPGETVWAAICCDALFGPFFLPGHGTSELCPTILRKKFCLAISDCPDIQEKWFKNDGALAHYANVVRKWLSDTFGIRWIS